MTSRVRQLAVGALALLAAAAIGWLAFRAAIVRVLPAEAPLLARLAPHDPEALLDRTMERMLTTDGRLPPRTFEEVAEAARRMPLDDRPFFLFGVRTLAAGQEARALAMLEEARRRNPRNRYARLILMDRYLRQQRFAPAVTEMTMLARLLPAASELLADQFAVFAVDRQVSAITRRALDENPQLLDQVLSTMARNGVAAVAVQRFAGAGAPRGLEAGGWRTTLIAARSAAGDHAGARALWAEAYRVAPTPGATVYDAGFRNLPGAPPFDWATQSNEIGSAQIGGGTLAIDYYGRRSGELASQLLLLAPGVYRLRYAAEGSGSDAEGALAWTLACAATPDAPFVTLPMPRIGPTRQLTAASFVVPADCPAQWLRLVGNAQEFAAQLNARISDFAIEPQP